jgi:hypothetical protein
MSKPPSSESIVKHAKTSTAATKGWHRCGICKRSFRRAASLGAHKYWHHRKSKSRVAPGIVVTSSSFGNGLVTNIGPVSGDVAAVVRIINDFNSLQPTAQTFVLSQLGAIK